MHLRYFTALLSCILMTGSLYAQEPDAVPAKVISAFGNGDAKALSAFFNSKIELVILERENVYSKTQAEMIMKSFFESNKPGSFKIIHKGGRVDAKYAIGLYSSENKIYRVYMLIKSVNHTPRIHQLRIEKENGQS